MAEIAEKLMTVAEFLTWNDGTDTRYELSMAGPSRWRRSRPATPSSR